MLGERLAGENRSRESIRGSASVSVRRPFLNSSGSLGESRSETSTWFRLRNWPTFSLQRLTRADVPLDEEILEPPRRDR